MAARSGERLRPLPARDARGRFIPRGTCSTSTALELSYDEESLLRRFDETGTCRFPDPWTEDGWFVIETRQSLKHFPVAMRYEGPLLGEPDYGSVVKYDPELFGNRFPPGEVALSPMPHFGDPGDQWEGHWVMSTNLQLAQLYIHAAHSANLHEVECGDQIGYVKPDERRYV